MVDVRLGLAGLPLRQVGWRVGRQAAAEGGAGVRGLADENLSPAGVALDFDFCLRGAQVGAPSPAIRLQVGNAALVHSAAEAADILVKITEHG